jgi:hypothetical protein
VPWGSSGAIPAGDTAACLLDQKEIRNEAEKKVGFYEMDRICAYVACVWFME